MDFSYIKRLKPFVILAMILIFMPVVSKAGGLIPSQFNGFAVTNDGTVIVGNNISITGYKNNKQVFSFPVSFNSNYSLNTNQDDNIVIYTKNARFVFSQDGTPLIVTKNNSVDISEIKKRQIITLNSNTSYVLTNRFGIINTVTKIENGEKTVEYTTPSTEILVELAFWQGNLILIVSSFAMLLDIRRRRFVPEKTSSEFKNTFSEIENRKSSAKKDFQPPKFLKAFSKPEISNKGAAFSSEYSTKPGEKPRFLEKTEKTDDIEGTDNQ